MSSVSLLINLMHPCWKKIIDFFQKRKILQATTFQWLSQWYILLKYKQGFILIGPYDFHDAENADGIQL